VGWKDDLDRKFLDTIRQLKLQKAGLEQQLVETQKALTESGVIKKSLANRITRQTLLISELRESHPHLVEIDAIYQGTMENLRIRRSQILRLKLELEYSRKATPDNLTSGHECSPSSRTGSDIPGRQSLASWRQNHEQLDQTIRALEAAASGS
jgi:hypothetical protein